MCPNWGRLVCIMYLLLICLLLISAKTKTTKAVADKNSAEPATNVFRVVARSSRAMTKCKIKRIFDMVYLE